MRATCFVTVVVHEITPFRIPLLFVQTVEHSLRVKDETPKTTRRSEPGHRIAVAIQAPRGLGR